MPQLRLTSYHAEMRTAACRLALLSVGWLAVALASPAAAQPVHDNWAARKTIAALPYSDAEANPAGATTEATDPSLICRVGPLNQGADSVWYGFTTGPTVQYVNVSTVGSTYDTVISVYTGTAGSLRLVHGGCNDNGSEMQTWSRINGLRLQANTSYSIEVTASIAAGAGALTFSLAAAPTYPVTTNADTVDGVCDANCSLRDAMKASTDNPGAVLVPAGTYVLEILGSLENANDSGDLDMSVPMGLYGAGETATVIDGGAIENVLHVDPLNTGAVTAIIGDLTLTHSGNTGIQSGGGITANSFSDFLALDHVVITNCHMNLAGGGIFFLGRGTIWSSTISGNSAGGLNGGGGGLMLAGDANTTFEIRDATISNNVANAEDSFGNSGGGGIHAHSRLVLINSTVSGNNANVSGGGILVDGGASAFIASTTITNNRADANFSGTGNGGGLAVGAASTAGTLVIRNSVIANNLDASVPSHPDCTAGAGGASITSSYDHLEATAGGCAFAGTGDVTGTDPALAAALGNNGGPTQTHLILSGSPLIDAGNPAGCLDDQGAPILLDQRQGARAVDGDGNASVICDKGAVEYLSGVPVELIDVTVE